MRLPGAFRKLFAVAFVVGIGTVGVQEADAGATDAPTDFTTGRRRRPLIERPVEPPDPDNPVFCVIDIETTGFSATRDAIIEIGVICYAVRDSAPRVTTWSALVRPSVNIPRIIRDLTGITNDMVADAETIDQVLPRVAALVGDAPLVAHNANFDRRFLEHNARALGLSFAGNAWVCTMRMAQRAAVGGPYTLGVLAEKFDAPPSNHRALADCHTVLGVYHAVRDILGGDVTLRPLDLPDDPSAPREIAYDADLSGQVFVFSGFRDEVLAARIGNAGGRVAGGISRKVTTLLVADIDEPATGKVRKAVEYGIPVRSRADFEGEFYVAETEQQEGDGKSQE